MSEIRERYNNLDGLRAIACICIIAMHIKANGEYHLGAIGGTFVSSWTHFVALFLMISGFGMFCGYYGRFRSGDINLNEFYGKRYKKLLPFFVTLIVLDIAMSRSISHVIEGVTEASLVFGLLPNNQPSVIGVCWTLGVIFLFYIVFPFVVYLCWNKRRAWMTFAFSIALSLMCSYYFFTDKFVIEGFAARHNFLYCAPWIIGGGIAYLHRNALKTFVRRFRWPWFCGCVCLTVLYYFLSGDDSGLIMIKNLLIFLPWLIYAFSVESRILSNRVMRYLSGISLELYLAQMVVFRVVEKVHCLYLVGHGWGSFLIAWVLVVVGLLVFISVWKRLWILVQRRLRIALR